MVSNSLDELLEGGVYSGEVTELCGAPGVGKTQVSTTCVIQLSLLLHSHRKVNTVNLRVTVWRILKWF